MGLNVDQGGIDETRGVQNFEDRNCPVLRPSCDRRVQTHDNWISNRHAIHGKKVFACKSF